MGANVLDPHLTPTNSQPLERALMALWEMHLPDVSSISWLVDPERCPAQYLHYLAASVGVLFWDPLWSVGTKREMIRWTIWLHQWAGTRVALDEVLRIAGYESATIVEAKDLPRIGADNPLGSDWKLGISGTRWADYWVEVTTPITRRQANNLASLLKAVVPAFCRLRSLKANDVHFTIGDGTWRLGREIALGATYYFEETDDA